MTPEHDPVVRAALRALAQHDGATMRSAPHVQSALLSHVRVRATARLKRRRYWLLAAAAGLAGLVAMSTQRSPTQVPSTSSDVVFVRTAREEVTTDFLPLVDGNMPFTDGQLVRIEVPRTTLQAFGLVLDSGDLANAALLADVVVGEDGVARAVRFVRAVTD